MTTEDDKKQTEDAKIKWLEIYKFLAIFAREELLPHMQMDIVNKLRDENEQLKEQIKNLSRGNNDLYKENRMLVMELNKKGFYRDSLFNAYQMRILELEKQLREATKK